jgi:hypothetical protein
LTKTLLLISSLLNGLRRKPKEALVIVQFPVLLARFSLFTLGAGFKPPGGPKGTFLLHGPKKD